MNRGELKYKGYLIWYDDDRIDYPWRIHDASFASLYEAKQSVDSYCNNKTASKD